MSYLVFLCEEAFTNKLATSEGFCFDNVPQYSSLSLIWLYAYNIYQYFYIIHLKKCCARSWCWIRARLLFCLEKYQANQVDAKTKSDVHHKGSKMRSGKVNRSWAKQLCGNSQGAVLQGISGLVDVDMCSRDLFFPQRKWGPSALNDCNGKHGIFIHVTSTCFLHFERQDSSSWLRLQCVTSST